MLKKIFCFMLCILISISFCFYAFADVIFQPDDDFFKKNKSSCVYVNRYFKANNSEGKVTAYNSPVSSESSSITNNTNEFKISYTYTDINKVIWALYEQNNWIKLDELNLIFDAKSFDEIYSDKYEKYNGELNNVKVNKEIVFWTYPGSGKIYYKFDGSIIKSYKDIGFTSVYKDKNGDKWAKINYFRAIKNVWVYLKDPGTTKTPIVPQNLTPKNTFYKSGVNSDNINSNSVNTKNVNSNKVKSNSVESNNVNSNKVKSNNINSNSVDSNNVNSNSVDSNIINSNSVDSNIISSDTIKTAQTIVTNSSNNHLTLIIAISLVAFVIIATLVIIIVLYKKKKK